jgi:hypothetical protein
MQAIPPIAVTDTSAAYVRLDALKSDGLQIDANLAHLLDALQSSEAAGGLLKPYQKEVMGALAAPEIDQAELMATSIRLNEAAANVSMLQSAVSMAAAMPNKLLKLGGGG